MFFLNACFDFHLAAHFQGHRHVSFAEVDVPVECLTCFCVRPWNTLGVPPYSSVDWEEVVLLYYGPGVVDSPEEDGVTFGMAFGVPSAVHSPDKVVSAKNLVVHATVFVLNFYCHRFLFLKVI